MQIIRKALTIVFMLSLITLVGCVGKPEIYLATEIPISSYTLPPKSTIVATETDERATVGCVITTPDLDSWYAQYCSSLNIDILSSSSVDPLALQQSYDVIVNMFLQAPELAGQLAAAGLKVVIYDDDVKDEKNNVPNLSKPILKKGTYDNINFTVVTWDDDLICDPPKTGTLEGWSQLTIHEIGHALHHIVIDQSTELKNRLSTAYDDPERLKVWGEMDITEYFAWSVSAYFGVYSNPRWNEGLIPARQINRNDLEAYDPEIYLFLEDFFSGVAWSPTCP